MSENSLDRVITSLVTQLSATPPAMHKLSNGTLRLARRTSAMTAASVAACKSGCDIGMPRQDFIVHAARRTKHGFHSGELVRLHAEEILGYSVVLLVDAQDRFELLAEDFRIAVSRQPHDFRSVVGAKSRDTR